MVPTRRSAIEQITALLPKFLETLTCAKKDFKDLRGVQLNLNVSCACSATFLDTSMHVLRVCEDAKCHAKKAMYLDCTAPARPGGEDTAIA